MCVAVLSLRECSKGGEYVQGGVVVRGGDGGGDVVAAGGGAHGGQLLADRRAVRRGGGCIQQPVRQQCGPRQPCVYSSHSAQSPALPSIQKFFSNISLLIQPCSFVTMIQGSRKLCLVLAPDVNCEHV